MSSSPEKKKRKKTPTTTTDPSLPDDLLLSCFARVSRLHYKSISLVSKRCHSLITSKMLHQIRTDLGLTETCLYICLWFPPDPNPHWFTLYRKPDQTEDTTKKKTKMSNGNLFIPIPNLNSLPVHGSSLVAVGSEIYNIGGSNFDVGGHLSNVSILDCQSHTWRKAPNLLAGRNAVTSSVVDGKIYVGGGFDNPNIEVFDTKTQIWVRLPEPECHHYWWLSRSVCIDGKFHLMNMRGDGLVYDPKECSWKRTVYGFCDLLIWNCHCAIENVFYCYVEGMFKWFDNKRRRWKKMSGLVGMPKIGCHASVKLVDYGGKMAVLWDKRLLSGGYKEKMIWCAVIGLEKRYNGKEKIWGNVEWCEAVLNVPKSYEFESALALTV